MFALGPLTTAQSDQKHVLQPPIEVPQFFDFGQQAAVLLQLLGLLHQLPAGSLQLLLQPSHLLLLLPVAVDQLLVQDPGDDGGGHAGHAVRVHVQVLLLLLVMALLMLRLHFLVLVVSLLSLLGQSVFVQVLVALHAGAGCVPLQAGYYSRQALGGVRKWASMVLTQGLNKIKVVIISSGMLKCFVFFFIILKDWILAGNSQERCMFGCRSKAQRAQIVCLYSILIIIYLSNSKLDIFEEMLFFFFLTDEN